MISPRAKVSWASCSSSVRRRAARRALPPSSIHLVGDDPADGVLVERIASAGAVAAGGQFPHDVGGGSPGGVLLKDVPHGGGLLLVDAVVLVRPDVVAKAAVAAQGNALECTLPLAAAEFLRQFGGVILGQGFHQALNDNTLWAVYHRFGGIQNLDPVPPQAGLVDDGVVAAAGEAVCFPADHSVEEVAVAVGDHLLERRAAVALAGNVAVDILMDDLVAVGFGVGLTVPALTLNALLGLLAAVGVAIVCHQAQAAYLLQFLFARHKYHLSSSFKFVASRCKFWEK